MCQPGAKAGKVKKSRSSRRTVENAEEEADRSGKLIFLLSGCGLSDANLVGILKETGKLIRDTRAFPMEQIPAGVLDPNAP